MLNYDLSGLGRGNFVGGPLSTQIPQLNMWGQFPHQVTDTIGHGIYNQMPQNTWNHPYQTVGQHNPYVGSWINRDFNTFQNTPFNTSQFPVFSNLPYFNNYFGYNHPYVSQGFTPWNNMGMTPTFPGMSFNTPWNSFPGYCQY